METEIIQGPPIIQVVAGKPCKECEEDKAQKDLLEEKRVETDQVTLSGESPRLRTVKSRLRPPN